VRSGRAIVRVHPTLVRRLVASSRVGCTIAGVDANKRHAAIMLRSRALFTLLASVLSIDLWASGAQGVGRASARCLILLTDPRSAADAMVVALDHLDAGKTRAER
jgi:hypothetical protein